MLETVREFAHHRLGESDELDDVRRRLATYMLALAEEGRPLARGPDERALLGRLALELENLRAALTYALEADDAALGLTLAEALEPLWIRGMRQREAVRWLEPLLELDGEVDHAVRAGALTLAGRSAIESGDIERAEPWFRAGLALARQAGDELRTAWALHGLGHLLAERGRTREAQALFEESMELFLRLGEHAPAAGRMTYLAYYAAREGDLERARSSWSVRSSNTGWPATRPASADASQPWATSRSRPATGGGAASVSRGAAAVAPLAFDDRHRDRARRGSRRWPPSRRRRGVSARLWGAFERLDAAAERKLDADDRVRYERVLGELDESELEAGRALSDEEALELARVTADELAAQQSSSR